ncbi:MAG TPA: MBL fold metallo-hydrolase [Gaiella sp.]|nr:MBL fold metallo-hydrolase [Gaiella sp.]
MTGASTVPPRRIVCGELSENCYVAARGADAVVIDPGGGVEEIARHVAERDLRIHAVLNTHAHADHLVAAAAIVERYRAPFHLHPADEGLLARANFYRRVFHGEGRISVPALDVSLEGVETLRFGELEVDVLHTPGHTPGSVCFRIGDDVFTGDTLGAEHVGRTDLPGGDRDALEASIAAIAEACPSAATIWPGHGEPAPAAEVLEGWARLAELRG